MCVMFGCSHKPRLHLDFTEGQGAREMFGDGYYESLTPDVVWRRVRVILTVTQNARRIRYMIGHELGYLNPEDINVCFLMSGARVSLYDPHGNMVSV
jgi:hypothetical protein